jgi:2-polyprenyl-6-methoxyphenol hydroxylase-like FAD-dependent oxidoreductase
MSKPSALIIGGSMAGLFAANLLYRAGWQVQVLEKSTTPLTSRGTGIATHAGLMKVMELAGARFGDALGVPINTRKAFDASGNILAQLKTQQVMASWSRLLSFLLEALPTDLYQIGKMVTRVEPGDVHHKAVVHLAGGESLQADLVVAADGYRSWCRHNLFQAPAPEYAGYVAWRAMAPSARLDTAHQALLHDGMMISQLPGDQILGYPVMPSDHNNDVHINIVWYRKTDPESLKILLTDNLGVQHNDGIAPKLIHPQVLQNLKQQAADTLHPAWNQIIELAPELFMQPIYDSVTSSMARSRVALIGDAAFISRPHIGQGVTKAAGDALCLVQSLQSHANDVLNALPIFSEKRVAIGHQVIQYAQRLGSVISQPGGDLAIWSQRYSNVDNVLRDTAVELDGVACVS